MTRERGSQHPLTGMLRKLHSADPTISGRWFRIVDWANRCPEQAQSAAPEVRQAFIDRGSRGEFPMNKRGVFDPFTYIRAVFGYLDDDQGKPFLAEVDEIVDPEDVMSGYAHSVKYAAERARKLLDGARDISRRSASSGGNSALLALAGPLEEHATQMVELLTPGVALLATPEGARQLALAADHTEALWHQVMAISDEIHRQYADEATERVARKAWMKHSDFYCHFGFPDGYYDEPPGMYARGSVLDTLGWYMKEALEFRNAVRWLSVNVSAMMDWLIAYGA